MCATILFQGRIVVLLVFQVSDLLKCELKVFLPGFFVWENKTDSTGITHYVELCKSRSRQLYKDKGKVLLAMAISIPESALSPTLTFILPSLT
jgi:hypothetical protein